MKTDGEANFFQQKMVSYIAIASSSGAHVDLAAILAENNDLNVNVFDDSNDRISDKYIAQRSQ